MEPDDVVPEDLHRQFVAGVGVLAEHSDRGIVAERDGITITAVGRGGEEFNTAWVRTPPADPDTIGRVLETLGGTGRPHFLQIPTPYVAAMAPTLTALGYECEEQVPAMTLECTGVAPVPPGDGLRIERVRDHDRFPSWLDALARGFGAPGYPSDPDEHALPESLLDVDRVVFLQVVDETDTVVGTAVCVLEGETGGLYAITTPPSHRRRGIGAASTMAAAAEAAQHGAQRVHLHATAMGEPVYRRLGFRTVLTYDRFAPAGPRS